MNIPFNFDDQSEFNTIEINNELVYQVLSPELDTQFLGSQLLP